MNSHVFPVRLGVAAALGALALGAPAARAAVLSEHDHGRVGFDSAVMVTPDEYQSRDVVSIMGSTTVDGEAGHNAVAIMGDARVGGTVDHDVVVVLGNLFVNGTVGHNAVAVMGNVHLGPRAWVEGDVVCVNGTVDREPGSRVDGSIVHNGLGSVRAEPSAYPRAGLFRHLWGIGGRHSWWWSIAAGFILLYALVALVAPGAVRRCGDQLHERLGLVVLSALLTPPALPIVAILLCVTFVGILFVPFLLLAVLLLAMFGKASVYAAIGRAITRDRVHPAAAVLLGGAVCLLFYSLPIVGYGISCCLLLLGLGCAFTALFSTTGPGKSAPPAAPLAVSAPPGATISVAPPPAPEPIPPVAPTPESVPPPPPAAAGPLPPAAIGLPRAGFWIRIGGLLVDAMVLVVFAHFWLIAIAIYSAVMWKLKGATLGGIVFGLKVVRLDGRPIEWDTAIVRALGCYLSAVALFLGFIWIAFDGEKQAWHDKIAGTVVVHAKGLSLV